MEKEKELKVYKNGTGNFKLLSSFKQGSEDYELSAGMWFSEPLEQGDLMWAADDIAKNDRTTILVVEEFIPTADDEAIVSVRRPSYENTKELRKFAEGEMFKIIATFREQN